MNIGITVVTAVLIAALGFTKADTILQILLGQAACSRGALSHRHTKIGQGAVG